MSVGGIQDENLLPLRAFILGSGRCGTYHISRMFDILFSNYVHTTHEYQPTYARHVVEVYDKWDFTSHRTRDLARLKWRNLMGRRHVGGERIHRWVDSSTFNVPFVYHLGMMDPDLKFIVMLRHPEGFVRSVNAMLHMEPYNNEQRGFIWDRVNFAPRWAGNPEVYWMECYALLQNQFECLGRDPDLVMFLDSYREGAYANQLLRLFDIPETQQNVDQIKWFCSQRAANFSKNREVWKSTEIPDLSGCKRVWDWWEDRYEMAKEKSGI